MNRRIVLSSDHAGLELRGYLANHIATLGWIPVDIGPTSLESTDYPRHAVAAAHHILTGDCRFGVLVCGTGQGIMMAANKVPGIRCGTCGDVFSARMMRAHNDANMIAFGARVIDQTTASELIEAFLAQGFEGGRHALRVGMLDVFDDPG